LFVVNEVLEAGDKYILLNTINIGLNKYQI